MARIKKSDKLNQLKEQANKSAPKAEPENISNAVADNIKKPVKEIPSPYLIIPNTFWSEKLGKSFDKGSYKPLNEEEKKLSQRAESVAGYWAAKEAISKALGCGIGAELSFLDIVIYKDEKNAPHFKLNTKAQKLHNITNSSLSISHDGGFAIAMVVIIQD